MGRPAKSRRYAAGRRPDDLADNELRELALLREFNSSELVAALAGAIAARLGRKARTEKLIAEAGFGDRTLGAGPREPLPTIGSDEVKQLKARRSSSSNAAASRSQP